MLDIYKTEFTRAIANQNIEKLITDGKIRVCSFIGKFSLYSQSLLLIFPLKINGQIKPLHYLIKNGDKISHTKHVNKFFFKFLNEFFEKKKFMNIFFIET